MKVLTAPAKISETLIRLIGECASCQVAVAWASSRFAAFNRLMENQQKIERMIVSLHFHQTDPDFIEAFLLHPTRVRYIRYTDGVFHPKVYLFEKGGGEWECIIGSPNFTRGGFSANDEIAVLLTNRDEGASEALAGIKASISGYWLEAEPLSQANLETYRKAWRHKQSTLETLQTPFGTLGEMEEEKGKPIAPAKLLQKWTWAEYYGYIASRGESAPQHYSVIGRLRVIRSVQSFFAGGQPFAKIDLDGRHKIAGTLHYAHGTVDGVNYHWFGSMWGAGKFKAAVVAGEKLSIGLDAIPFVGQVTREDYLRYIIQFQKALAHGGAGIATATRLLAMKRPDTFVCFNDRNKAGLAEAFDVDQNISYEGYWDSLIEPVRSSTWWRDSSPRLGVELEVWDARAAFLDSICYDAKDMLPS